MANLTPIYSFNLPVVGGDTDQWGTELNANWTNIDGYLNTTNTTANAALPKAGGTLTGPVTGTSATFSSLSAPQAIGDNRIINGDMRIDQRNNGASGTATNVYTVDRWQYAATQASKGIWNRQTLAGLTSGAGFAYSLLFTSSSAYTSLAADQFYFQQPIEADLVTDFCWGQAAQSVTLSFWTQSSLTGTFSGAIQNQPSPPTRSYPFTFSIPTAGAWTRIVVTIPGDTAGTWVMYGNAACLRIVFDLGTGSTGRGPANAWASAPYYGATGAVSVVGTNGATFQITGVKLEVGTVATPYNRQSLAKSMSDCQRYYQTSVGGYTIALNIYNSSGGAFTNTYFFPVTMRANPTVTVAVGSSGNATGLTAVGATPYSTQFQGTVTTTGLGYFNFSFTASAEL